MKLDTETSLTKVTKVYTGGDQLVEKYTAEAELEKATEDPDLE